MCARVEEDIVVMAGSVSSAPLCSVAAPLEIMGGRWKAPILFYLLTSGTQRFGAIRRFLPHASQRMLTLQLRELEADGVISRHVYAEVPSRVDYSLTEFGRSLEPILMSMLSWGRIYKERVARLRESGSRAALVCSPVKS